jgi:predicted transcriptional regulator
MLEYNDSLTIGEMIRIIATEHERTCILKNSDGRLYGVVSQGDLIKAIWNCAELITPISNIINPNPFTISTESKDPKKEALKLFSQHGVLLVPIVDANRKITSVISIRKIISDEYGN